MIIINFECPPLHLSVVAIEKGAFSTMITNFTYFTDRLAAKLLHKTTCKIL